MQSAIRNVTTRKPETVMNRLLILFLLSLSSLHSKGSDISDSLLLQCEQNLEQFSIKYPQERVYLHFDNTSYFKNEDIWYKAYVVRDDNLHHTNLSRILYVELLNPIGYPVETQKLVIEDGQAHGSFHLKDTLNAGFYEIRAYTTWMLNFTTGDPHGWKRLRSSDAKRHYGERLQRYLDGNAGVFSRVFPIYEAVDSGRYAMRRMSVLPKATASLVSPVKDNLVIDFYPEGGNIIRDVPTRIAFQAHNGEGRKLNVEGAMIRKGDSIGYFKTEYAGQGIFTIVADSLDTEELTDGLQLKLTYNGKDYRFRLPKAQKKGYSLSVFHRGDQLRTVVARNNATKGMTLGMNITSRGKSLFYQTLDLTQQLSKEFAIDKKVLQTGVNVVTIFTDKGKVLAQRLVYVNNHDSDGYRIKIDMPTEALDPYGKVDLNCQLTDAEGNPVKAAHEFSMAVTDKGSRDATYDDATIQSYLLLSSELKGFIPHPEYYFESDDAEHQNALDMLMMIQGWTRYDYEQMMSGSDFQPLYPIERGLTFGGRLWDDKSYDSRAFWKLQDNKPVWVYSELYVNGDTMLTDRSLEATIDHAGFFHEGGARPHIILTGEAKVDSTGCFRLNMIPFYGKGRIALMLNKESIEEVGLEKGGVGGHNFRWNTVRRPKFLLGKRIEPLNQYSPLPKNYDYYETAALNDPVEKDMFRYKFMTTPKDEQGGIMYYDALTKSYVLPNVTKKKRRRWSDFREVVPVCVMDVKDMMAWLSNIYGDISDFKFSENDAYLGTSESFSHEAWINEMMMSDAKWMDQEFNTKAYSAMADRYISQRISFNEYQIDNKPYYARLSEMLYIFGLDGMNRTFVGAGMTGGDPHYVHAAGLEANLPRNMHFFPINENFHELRLYADIDNRKLIHKLGSYHETVFSYDSNSDTNDDRPLTSIFNFTIDSLYSNSHPMPDFLGFRINFQGLTPPTEFYHPNYDWEPEPEETDYRRTVYWNPKVTTDSEGRARVEIFNNGFSKKLAVTAEGITAGGQTIVGSTNEQEE